jgi:hypothetical protein
MENKNITLIRKQSSPFTVTYPSQLPDGRINATFSWLGTKGKTISKKEVPVEVFRWLNEQTTTIRDGHLLLENIPETDDAELNEIKEITEEVEIKLNKAVKTEEQLKEILSTGNHLVFQKALNDLTKGLDEDSQIDEIKRYVYRTYMDMGIESSAKVKILCDWFGSNYEDCKDLFDKELNK